MSWRTRTRGSERQRGLKFPITVKAQQIRKRLKYPMKRITPLLKKKLLRQQEGWKIYEVDGDVVRKYLYWKFWRGAHGNISYFVPKGEIWVERGLSPKIREGVILHEILEAQLMEKNGDVPYEIAHEKHAVPAEEHFKKAAKGEPLKSEEDIYEKHAEAIGRLKAAGKKKLYKILYLDHAGRKQKKITDNVAEFYRQMRQPDAPYVNIISVKGV